MTTEINAPIFIVGAPRSGTSILFRKLGRNPELAWISNITKKYESSKFISRAIMLFRSDHRPTEAKKVWKKYSRRDDGFRGREDVTPKVRRYIEKVVRINLEIFGKPRFLAKDPGNALRMDFIDEIFPDAIFIHIVRDARAVVESVVKVRRNHNGVFWGSQSPGWRDLIELPLVEASALQWKRLVEVVLDSAKKLPEDRYMQLRYEDFAADPAQTLRAIGEKCSLKWDEALLKEITGDIRSQNFKWRENLKPDEIETVNAIAGDLLERFAYEI